MIMHIGIQHSLTAHHLINKRGYSIITIVFNENIYRNKM